MTAINLRDRLIGRPATAKGLITFVEYVGRHDWVWFCTGQEIADHWHRSMR